MYQDIILLYALHVQGAWVTAMKECQSMKCEDEAVVFDRSQVW